MWLLELAQKVFGFLTMLGIFAVIYSKYKQDTSKKTNTANESAASSEEAPPVFNIKKQILTVLAFAVCYGICTLMVNYYR